MCHGILTTMRPSQATNVLLHHCRRHVTWPDQAQLNPKKKHSEPHSKAPAKACCGCNCSGCKMAMPWHMHGHVAPGGGGGHYCIFTRGPAARERLAACMCTQCKHQSSAQLIRHKLPHQVLCEICIAQSQVVASCWLRAGATGAAGVAFCPLTVASLLAVRDEWASVNGAPCVSADIHLII